MGPWSIPGKIRVHFICVTWGAFGIVLVFKLSGSRIKWPSSRRTPLYLSSMCLYHTGWLGVILLGILSHFRSKLRNRKLAFQLWNLLFYIPNSTPSHKTFQGCPSLNFIIRVLWQMLHDVSVVNQYQKRTNIFSTYLLILNLILQLITAWRVLVQQVIFILVYKYLLN